METSLLPMFMTSESYVRLLADPVFLSVDRPDSAASKGMCECDIVMLYALDHLC